MRNTSIIRDAEHETLKTLTLTGKVLDLGGSRLSGYHDYINGEHEFVVVNFGDVHPGQDLNFDIQEKFPLQDSSYDNVISMNVLEHIFDFNNVFAETHRVLKSGGLFVNTTPFIHHIHGSPDDYFRYTKSAIEKLATKHGFILEDIKVLGFGLFSLIFQTVGGWIPTKELRFVIKKSCIFLDKVLLNFSKYKALNQRIPLGYYSVMRKK
jgi:SAM-dependent methyltransferase